MRDSPEAVYLYIPLMKELNMSWKEIKKTPKIELEGIIHAYSTYSRIHAFDGYSSDDIGQLAKDKPQIRSDYAKSMETRARLEEKAGRKRTVGSFEDLI